MFKLLMLTSFLHSSPLPLPQWDAFFSFGGSRDPQEVILIQCHKTYFFEEDRFNEFCEKSKTWLRFRRVFCVRAGLHTKAKCIDIINQNMKKKKVWIWE